MAAVVHALGWVFEYGWRATIVAVVLAGAGGAAAIALLRPAHCAGETITGLDIWHEYPELVVDCASDVPVSLGVPVELSGPAPTLPANPSDVVGRYGAAQYLPPYGHFTAHVSLALAIFGASLGFAFGAGGWWAHRRRHG